MPISYSQHPPELWSEFAKLVLDATYGATFCAAILNFQKTGNNKLYLTFIGGGAFGNSQIWIMNSIQRSLNLYKNVGLDVIVVSHNYSNHHIQNLIKEFNIEK